MEASADLKASYASKMARWMNPVPGETAWAAPSPVLPAKPDKLADEESALEQIEKQMAVSGRIVPNELVGHLAPGRQQPVLNRLVDNCVVEANATGVTWLLTQPRRIELLAKAQESGTLPAMLNGPLPRTDRFGDLLRELLRDGPNVRIHQRPAEDLLALMEALETTQTLGLSQPDWTQIRLEIGLANFLNDQRVLLANGFFGRKEELVTLHRFLEDDKMPMSSPWKGLVVTGMGGSGKSTLLAKFAEEVVREKWATLITFDFDRPGLNPDDQLWLESEMARQVGYQYPAINETLRRERAASRQRRLSLDVGPEKSSYALENVSEERSLSLLASSRQALTDEAADRRPLLFIFDTFEEVDQQDLTEQVLSWLRTLAEVFWNFRLRVIFSGRLFDGALEKLLVATDRRRLDLGELSGKETQQLLKRLNVSDSLARRIARSALIPHRPLEMKLLANMLVEKGDTTLDEIEEELRTGGAAARSLFMGLVYRRVLVRIDDPVAKQLAYPGLVLRYVTVDLIQHVLAPILKLKLDRYKSQLALHALATHSWICYRGANDEVWHRKDLRRSMLSAMRAQEPELARQISERAFAYFSGIDTTKADTRLQAEQTYHRLLWLQQPDEGAAYDLITLKKAADFIGADAIDLPKPAAVLLQYAQRGFVSAENVELLPAEYLQKAYHKTGQRLLESREYGKAIRLYDRAQNVGTAYPQNGVHQPWELEALFATARWGTLDQALAHRIRKDSFPDNEFAPIDVYYSTLIHGTNFPVLTISQLRRQAGTETSTKKKNRKEAQSQLKQLLVYCILFNNAGNGRSERQLSAVRELVREAGKNASNQQSSHLDRKLLYLNLIAGPPWLIRRTLAPSLLKIDPVWLAHLVTQPFIREQAGDAGKALRQLLLNARALLTKKTVRRTLDTLDVLYKNKQDWQVWGDGSELMIDGQELKKWFRGPDPEFREPVRFALLDAFLTRADYNVLATIFQDVLALPFTDLEPDTFAAAMIPDPEHFLAPYIELVDRSWALGTLLTKAVAYRPKAASLVRVKDAYDRWDAAVNTAFLTNMLNK